MKNNWIAYASSLVATAVVVASTVFLPSALLHREESRMLGEESFLVNGSYTSQQYPKPVSTAATTDMAAPVQEETPSVPYNTANVDSLVSTKILYKKVMMMEDANSITQYSEPASGDMGMKEAYELCINKIVQYMKAGVMVPLPNFPESYIFDANLQTVISGSGESYFDYWSINFSADTNKLKSNNGIGLMMDAQTGGIIGFKMYTEASAERIDLKVAAKALASDLNIGGIKLDYPAREDGAETIVVASSDKSLFITFGLYTDTDSSSMSMSISTVNQN